MNKKVKTEKTETKPIKAELVTDEKFVSEITLVLPLKKKLEEVEKKFVIKDKLINELEVRLKKIEDQLKKKK